MADIRLKTIPDNMKCTYDNIDHNIYKVVTFFGDYRDNKVLKQFRKLKFLYYFAICKYLFVVDYHPFIYSMKPRKETKIVQLWHACGAFKKFGYSTIDKDWGQTRSDMEKYPIHNTYTHVFVSSSNIRKYYAEAFNIDISKIYDLGIPRTDIYFDEDFKARVVKAFNAKYNPSNKKVILYAPTFRGNSVLESYFDNKIDLEMFYKELGEEYIILFKLHPFLNGKFVIDDKYEDFAFNVSSDLTIEEVFVVSDMLISDYSSVIFEYSLLDRPIIMYPYDLLEYDASRGFYLDYEEYCCGDVAFDSEGLLRAIIKNTENFDNRKLVKFKEFFMSACKGDSTDKIMDLLFK
jgi:CDP-ribitol ribitolphosphotransferase